jgi:hypothetical protein
MNWWQNLMPPPFNPEGQGYDYRSALGAGLRPGPDRHWGSVAPASPNDIVEGIPPESYMMLKGQAHPTWNLGMEAELDRGYDIKKLLERYWSVPR